MMSDFQVVPFDLSPMVDNVNAALQHCMDAFDAALAEQERILAHAEELKREHEHLSLAMTEMMAGECAF